MPLGDGRYRAIVPPETQAFIEDKALGHPEWFVRGMEAVPYYPSEARELIRIAAARLVELERIDDALEVIRPLDEELNLNPPAPKVERNGSST